MRDIFKAEALIRERRERAEREREMLLEELLNDGEFAADYSRLSWLNFEIAKREVYGMPLEKLGEERELLREKIHRVLAEHGARGEGADYSCKACSDTGYINGKRCDCLERARIEINLSENPFLMEAPSSLKEIDFPFYGAKSAEYCKYARFLHNNFVKGGLNYCTLIGAPGTGKTYIAAVCVKEALYDGAEVRVINGVRLNRTFLEYHCAELARKASVWAELAEPDVLLIDDAGVEATLNNVTVQYLYELLTERADKKTVITSNLDLRGLENKYGQRILSRLADKRRGAFLRFSGEDYRIDVT